MPDPSCNPYLALAVMLRAGLDGIDQQIDPGPPVNKNIYKMSHRERRHLRIDDLPANLSEALDEFEKDELVKRRSASTSSSTSSKPSARSGTTTSATCRPGKWTDISASTEPDVRPAGTPMHRAFGLVRQFRAKRGTTLEVCWCQAAADHRRANYQAGAGIAALRPHVHLPRRRWGGWGEGYGAHKKFRYGSDDRGRRD